MDEELVSLEFIVICSSAFRRQFSVTKNGVYCPWCSLLVNLNVCHVLYSIQTICILFSLVLVLFSSSFTHFLRVIDDLV